MVSFSGEKRSGKTLTMTYLASLECKKRKIISSIPKLKIPHHRLKWTDLLTKKIDYKKTNSRTTYYKPDVNWKFWKENKGASLYIDEIHNLVGSRNFMSLESKCLTKWVSQIGKVQLDRGDWTNIIKLRKLNNNTFSKFIHEALHRDANFYFNSQRTEFIDVYFRRLTDIHINVRKIFKNNEWNIINEYYFSNSRDSAIDIFDEQKVKPKISWFPAKHAYNLYGTHDITTDGGEYV
jgi:hypothetical protein